MRLPFPDAPFELFASQSFARQALLGQLAFHDDLRRDAGVVHAREPQRIFAAHAVPACEHVDLRMLEHVADVDVAGHVRRRNDNRKHIAGRICVGAEQLLLHPSLGPARLNQLRLVNFGEFGALGRRFRCLFWRLVGQVILSGPVRADLGEEQTIYYKERGRSGQIAVTSPSLCSQGGVTQMHWTLGKAFLQ